MVQKGIEKQNPPDQRSRGLNPEHPEGDANARNHEEQTGGATPPPAPTPGG